MKRTVWIPVVLILASLLVSCGTKNDPETKAGTAAQSEEELLSSGQKKSVKENENTTEKAETKQVDSSTDLIREFYQTDAKLEELTIGSNKGGKRTSLYKVRIPGNYCCSTGYYGEGDTFIQMDETYAAPELSRIIEENMLANASVIPSFVIGTGDAGTMIVDVTEDNDTSISKLKNILTSVECFDLYETEDSLYAVTGAGYVCYQVGGAGKILKIQCSFSDKNASAKDYYDFCRKIITEVK